MNYLCAVIIKYSIMEATIYNPSMLDNYWNVIKDWSDNMKIALISKLKASMAAKSETSTHSSWASLYGIMSKDSFPTADEIREVLEDKDKELDRFVI